MYISKRSGVTIQEYDISTFHRLPASHGKTQAIIVRFNNRRKKTEFIANAKRNRLHGRNFGYNPALPIFINDHLSTHMMEIFNVARDLKKQGKLTHVWCKETKIYVRIKDGDVATKITSLKQLEQLDLMDAEQQIDGTDQNTGNEEHTTSATSVEPGTSNQVKNKPYADQDQEISPPFLRSARGGRGGRGISYSSRQHTMNDYQLKSKK
ncbi:hypothetical protein U1Q18_051318 [Sarracenia purpurea var. burkii]